MKQIISRFPYTFFTVLLCCCCGINAIAQLQANFTADKTGGCSPLGVKFTNTTTGASAAATWSWNFDNGNSSVLKDAGATYFTEKTYSITLTVKDGTATSTKTMDVTVYKKPTIDFTVSPAKGCVPLTVNYTANATAGDGSIANYLWDFGDGTNIQGINYSGTTHIYTLPQTPPITLNVTNSFGCFSTLTKSNQVATVKAVTATFTPSTFNICTVGDSVTFTNSSTGSATLTYKWDFGDGKSSTDVSPTHIYAAKGNYKATLVVTSSDGCSATLQSDNINVANFLADFSLPVKICYGEFVTFFNKSTLPYTNAIWSIDGNTHFTNGFLGELNYTFFEPREHSIKLLVTYGNCSVDTTKKIIVNALPVISGFIADLNGVCGIPVTINVKDTTREAVSWEWRSSVGPASTQNASFNYTNGNHDYVYLTVKNAEGCSNSTSKYINYESPNIYIYATGASITSGCTGLTVNFTASPDTAIKSFSWNLGDGSPLSTESKPTHVYNLPSDYYVVLNYITNNGCIGTAALRDNIIVRDKPKFDFASLSGTTICGNTPVTITATPNTSNWNYSWYINDLNAYNFSNSGTIIYQFTYDTTYTIKLIAHSNNGCSDTVVKKDYIKVLPPFPHIEQKFNTCDGNRGLVRFTEDSKKAISWSWDFGDTGTDSYTTFKDTIRHTYTKTGAYKVILTATNGACNVKDSIIASVLQKQKPLLAAAQTAACGSDVVTVKLSGYELNPNSTNYYSNYYLSKIEYGDFSTANPSTSSFNYYWETAVNGTLANLEPGKNDIRIISTSAYFICPDTSNFIPLKIHGPKAGFKVETHSGCFKDAVAFTDTSLQFGSIPIVKWVWNFGDNKTETLTAKGSTKHTYSRPGYYNIVLTVTDADGCTNSTPYFFGLTVDGPQADFYASAYIVPLNTTVNFYNNSTFFNSYYNATLKWIFSDSTTSTDSNPTFLFTKEGSYPVKLITTNTLTGCTDTMQKTIIVRKVNSAFTYRLSYINNNSCPPVIATFTSISTNAVRLSWDFGNGSIAGNQTTVSNTYNKPGLYRVVHYSYDSNTGVDSTEDFIEVKGPYALLKADTLYACKSLQVTLTAEVKNATDYTWDFGDGTVVPTKDTFAVHQYLTPGVYTPALILKDAAGCSATSELPQKVIIDSLRASFTVVPNFICDSALSLFTPQVNSLSNALLQSPLVYRWITNEAAVADTSYNTNARYFFNKIGEHTVNLKVTSMYGCQQNFSRSVSVKQGVQVAITGVDKLCQSDTTSFAGRATPANGLLQWKWTFDNGASAIVQNPAPQQYIDIGTKQITLIVNNGNCFDTAYHSLKVNAHPIIAITPASPFVCQGSSTILTASGGNIYQWSSVGALLNANNFSATVSPATGLFYRVKVTDTTIGCSSIDAVFVKVIFPVNLTVPGAMFACEGSPVQLNTSGADIYKWIKVTEGISNINIANPVALIKSSVTYTVVGYDNYNCFTDTANIFVRLSKLPLVNAGADKELIGGTPITLLPVISGAINWAWSPSTYLDCITCLNPVSKPTSAITYTLTAFNADGCKAKDEVTLRLVCNNQLVFIPTAFSPNNDNLNDRFVINGSGIKSIRSIIIYSRWGKVIFQKKNILINDRNNCWDGNYNGEPLPTGSYVYQLQTECDSGELFDYRGSVMIVR